MLRKTLAFALTVLFAVAGWVAADTKIVATNHTDGFSMMGKKQPAQDDQSVTWVGKDRMRMEQSNGTVVIVRLDQKKMYLVHPGDSTYTTVDLPLDLTKYMPPEMIKQMGAMMKFTATVTPTAETREINGWKAHKYAVTMSSPMMQMEQTVWATKDIKVPFDAYKEMSAQMQELQPGMADAIKELQKIDGVQVLSEGTMKMMGTQVATRHEVKSVTQEDAPTGAYTPPEGFKHEKFDFSQMMKNRKK